MQLNSPSTVGLQSALLSESLFSKNFTLNVVFSSASFALLKQQLENLDGSWIFQQLSFFAVVHLIVPYCFIALANNYFYSLASLYVSKTK